MVHRKGYIYLVDHPPLCPLSCDFVHSPMHMARILRHSLNIFCLPSVQISNHSCLGIFISDENYPRDEVCLSYMIS